MKPPGPWPRSTLNSNPVSKRQKDGTRAIFLTPPEQKLAYDQVVPEDLSMMDRIVLVGQLLLALRHPLNNGPSARRAREIARRMATTMILALPETLSDEVLAEWHKELDF